ncbi:non-ribosomal peptide synthetase/type I polyketide synthase [Ornithinimicrobium cerasi]|uniref:non-ribosomal peptide synthetase/type I polyketide synthase n=1 Tax=Ornithinimicrobium cerasi TaxID=2248773 RepID=UPI000EFF067D|nr:non-ribosomal peptide synthetase/type I polyketide synthase [Ornithinimicrobium cerasi]
MNRERTVLDLLLDAARDRADQVIVQVDGEGAERTLTHRGLLESSLRVAGGLMSAGLAPGAPVIVLPTDSGSFLPAFWGALAAGLLPVPLAPVPDRVLPVWGHLGRLPLVVDATLRSQLGGGLTVGEEGSLALLDIATLQASPPVADVHVAAPTDVAFLQFSSGSTGTPKGVRLTHANLLANIEQARTAGAARADDVLVTWLPYFHDMGLIGAHLTPLAVGMKQVTMGAADFGKRPVLWYQTATRHRATLLPMASFALDLTLRRVSADQVAALDLSTVRLVGVGSEPIPSRAWRRFREHLRPAGLDPWALVPLYGLAEATVAVTFPPLGELAEPLALDRQALADGRAVDVDVDVDVGEELTPADEHRAHPVELMDVGVAVRGGELRIVDDDRNVVPDSVVGQIEYRGPNVAAGYHDRPQETAETFVDGWLRTGDLGFLRAGRLCVTGRAKDVLFVNGQKFHAHDLEQVVTATPGVPPGRVAVVGYPDPITASERVAVFLTARAPDLDAASAVLLAVRTRVREALAHPDVLVLPVPPETFPRTTSGKIRRGRLRELLVAGEFVTLEQDVAAACTTGPPPTSAAPTARGEVEALVTDIWAQVLQVPAGIIGTDDRFLAIGGSSLTAMQVLGRLEEVFGGPLEPALLRDCATVGALTDHLLDRGDRAPGPDRGEVPAPAEVAAPAGPARDRAVASPAAVVGLACRLPDADSPEEFWANLVAGRDSVTEVPTSRWQVPDGARARWGAFLDDVAGFDADYFGLTPAEAAVTDPHARLLLEVAHEALERAGYAGARRRGRRIGVFVAVGESGYPELLRRALDDGLAPSAAALVGNLRNLVAARVAHHLDLSGPAMVVDTACSSALVALHQARRSLEAGECDLAVVGGVHLNLTPTTHQLLEAAQALSPTGRSRAFSAGADGFVPGEGAAALVLEPLPDARAAGDRVLALVRGSAVNNDGRSLSLMAPNPLLQEAVIGAAYRDAGIDPATVSYVEAHGTGTAIGDPIEARSLMRSFPASDGPRWIGSVKTNVGHLLNAAGMPSLLKVVLSLHHRRLPPSLHYSGPSPEFDLASAGLSVVTEPRPWTGPPPLRAGIDSFGFGGTNAHVILEQALDEPPPADGGTSPGPHLLTLSAATEGALRVAAADLAAHVRSHPDLDEDDVCRSVATARDPSRHRLGIAVQGDLAWRLEEVLGRGTVGVEARRRPRVALLFPGQGSQVPGMGAWLHGSQPAYRSLLEELSAATGPVGRQDLLGWSLDADADPEELADTAVAQPLVVAFGICLAHQLRAWGVRADAVLGHSVGELAAAGVSGALTPAEAVRFAMERGRTMQRDCAPGAMVAVSGAEAQVLPVVDGSAGDLSLAALNGPGRFVVSGTAAAVEAATALWVDRGCRVRRLRVSRAFHSAMMDPALDALRAAARDLGPGPPEVPLLSTVTGEWSPTLDPAYLADHARLPVRFGPAVERLLQEGYDTFVEVGPGMALSATVSSVAGALGTPGHVEVLPLLGPTTPDARELVGTVGHLWAVGVPVAPPPAVPGRPRVDVPPYPFQRRRHWLPEPLPQAPAHGSAEPQVSALLHPFGWQEAALPAGTVVHSVCLVGVHDDLAGPLADRLTRRGVTVHRPPVEALADCPPASVMVLLAGPAVDLDTVQVLDDVVQGASSLLRTVSSHLAGRPTPLVVVTEDVVRTAVTVERPRPGQSVLAALSTALPEEDDSQGVRVVDLSSLDDLPDRLEALVREVDAAPRPGDGESVAWRGGRRLTRVARAGTALRRDRDGGLPVDGRYLITGGAGGVGSAVARHLAARGHPSIVLVGRSPSCRPGLLADLEHMGASPRYVSADLGSPADVERLVAGLPDLDGVFHAAGLTHAGALRSLPAEAVEEVLAPKVRGTLLLTRALDRHGRRPSTFMLFSSISSALPGYAGGQAPYAAANAFLDAFAATESAAGRPMQSLNFAAWTGTGMAGSPLFALATRTREVPQLVPEAALRALCDAPSVTAAQLLVLEAAGGAPHVTAPRERGAAGELSSPPPPEPARPAGTVATLGTRSAPGPGADQPGVRDLVAGLIAPEIGQRPEELDDDASFLTMGLDSLTAVDLVKRLEEVLGRALPTTLLFEHPSVAELTVYLSSSPLPRGGPVGRSDDPAPRAAGAAAGQDPQAGAQEDEGEEATFGVTPVQQAFHTTGVLHPGVAAYACVRLTLSRPPDETLLARSLAVLEDRHPMLRMRLRPDGADLHQLIGTPAGDVRPGWFTVSDLDRPVEDVEDALCNRTFDLRTEPPIRVALLREDAGRAHLVVVVHHAAADGGSLHVLCEELWDVYTALGEGRPPDLPPLSSVFRDQVRVSAQGRGSEAFRTDVTYWRERLGAATPPAPLPYDGDPTADPAPPLRASQLALPAAVTDALRVRAAEHDVSLFHLVLSAYVRLLADLSGRPEVTVNVARAGRDARLPGIDRVVGPFADTLPLTVAITHDEAPGDLARSVRRAWLETETHGSVSSLDLARALPAVDAVPRTAAAASFSFARFPLQAPAGCPVRVTATAARTASAATRLSLVCWEFAGSLHLSWNYPARLFTPATIDRLTDELLAGLTSVAGLAPAGAAPWGLAGRILEQCRRAPDAVAVRSDEGTTSYAELEHRARGVARRLRREGVRPGDRVVLLTTPGADTVAGLVGILCCGASWVPLDPRHPSPRLADQAARTAARAVVCHAATRRLADGIPSVSVVDLDELADDGAPGSPDLPDAPVRPEDEAYVIFTSGTTGRPKGVPVTHRALTAYLDWAIRTFGYVTGDRMAATASSCFDASVRQLLAPLLVGATVEVMAPDVLRDPQSLLAEVERRRVTVWSSVPTLWRELLRASERRAAGTGSPPDLGSLRWVHVGGEPLPADLVRRWFDLFGTAHRVVNLYGPTEATINATYEVVDARPDDAVTRIPIGRPVAGTVVDVVGADGSSCPPGEPGELLLAGPGVTAGYLDEPELTESAFVERSGTRFYRTGDRVVRRADGRLDLLGRTDRQVKIRGHRVEPAEIEAVLEGHPGLERAAVLPEAVAAGGGPRLVAHVQPRRAPSDNGRAGDVDVEGLREHLAALLPDYMVPSRIRLVDDLPLTAAGKIDRGALPAVDALDVTAGAGTGADLALTATEALLADVWGAVLGVAVSRDDDFFALGGDSIAVLDVFARLEPHVPVLPAPTLMYRHRRLADLATAVDACVATSATDAGDPTGGRGAVPTPDAGESRHTHPLEPFPLTPAQRGFLLAEALSPDARSSWVSCFRVHGPLDTVLFQRATDLLVARHPMLRTALLPDRRPPLQREVPEPCTITVGTEQVEPEHLASRVAEERRHRFDPSGWPLVRLHLLELAPQEHALLVHGHHAVADGYSVVLLAKDLMALYDALATGSPAELPPLRRTFRDHAALLARGETGSGGSELAGAGSAPYAAPRLRSPDAPRDAEGKAPLRRTFLLDGSTAGALRRLATEEGATPYAPLLTAFFRALARLTGQPDLVVGVATTGRDHPSRDITRIVGPFAHLVPVRLAGEGTVREQLRAVSRSVTSARTGGATMHDLVGAPAAHGGGPSSFGAQFAFSYLDFGSLGAITGRTLRLVWDPEGGDMEPPPIGTDLFLSARPHDDGLRVTLRAAVDVLSEDRCEVVAEGLRRDLVAMAAHPPRTGRAGGPLTAEAGGERGPGVPSGVLDAAIVGYLPAPGDLLAHVGMPSSRASREAIRAHLFTDGRARLLEQIDSPLGSSGFLCLPLFADELAGRAGTTLSAETARAVEHAADLGARCVSLAGMIPSHTAYGLGVVRRLDGRAVRVSTGHAATAASVVMTTAAALEQAGVDLDGCTVAVVGLGSIGRSSLQLLLDRAGSPARLVLCDVPGRREHLTERAAELTSAGYPGQVVVTCTDPSPAPEVYEADLIVGAVSGGPHLVDVDRLRPGTVVVDDSFPHCFDVGAARRRMAGAGDVLVVGGGLLSCGPVERRPVAGVLDDAQRAGVMSLRLPDSIPSCQLESLLQSRHPDLPLVHGVVDPALALAYWDALVSTGVTAAPLHLGNEVVPTSYLRAFRGR